MRKLLLILCVAAATTLSAAFTKEQDFRPASPAELAMKGVDYAPGAAAAVLDWVEMDDDTLAVSSEYYRVKIFTEDGKKYADVEVPYLAGYPWDGRVTDVNARTIQPDGKIVPFDGKVYDKVLYRAGGMRLRAKTFSLAGVQPGSILEYRFQRRWNELLLSNTLWTIQREIPVLRAKFTLKPYAKGEYSSYFTYFNLPEGKVPVRVRDRYELELTNVPVFAVEELSPPEQWLKSRVNFYYTSEQVAPEKFWAGQTAQWSKAVDGFIGKPDALRTQAQTLAGKDAMETARNVYAKAQGLKNLSYENEPTARDKKNAAEVWSKGEGYREEINRAFVAMARAAGLEANVVRVAPRDTVFFSEAIPDAEQMSTELAQVTIDGKNIPVDPSTPTAPFGVQSWEKSATSAYVIPRRGEKTQLMRLAITDPADAITRRVAALTLDGDTLQGTITATFSGQEALRRRLRSWGDDDAARTKVFEDEAKAWFPDGATVKLTQLTGTTSHEDAVVAKFDVTLTNLVSSAGSRMLLPASIFVSKNPFAAATRVHPVYFSFPYREEDEVKLTIAPSLAPAIVPPPANLNAGAVVYTNETNHSGNEVTFKRSKMVNMLMVEAKQYDSLRTFYSRIVAADQKPLVLEEKR